MWTAAVSYPSTAPLTLDNHNHTNNQGRTKRMQATARRLSVVSATSCARRGLIRSVRRLRAVSTESATQETASSPTGGCSLGCAGTFVLVGLLFPFLHMLGGTWEGGEMMLLPMVIGLPSFVVGHVLAIIAICSSAPSARRAGKRALLLIWCSIALVALIGTVADTFFRHPHSEASP